MMGGLASLVVGLLLLIAVFVFIQRAVASGASTRDPVDPQEVLNALQGELLPDWFVERLFSAEDRQFAHRESPSAVARLDRERKAVALSWLRQTRELVGQLMSFHLRSARQTAGLKPAVEVELAWQYLAFSIVCRVLTGWIRMAGPAPARAGVGWVVARASEISAATERMLGELDRPAPVEVGQS